MGEKTTIGWTNHTFNPWIGCTKVSPACARCYAERATPTRAFGVKWGEGEPRRLTGAETWRQPLIWDRKARREGARRRVFCASLADVFDDEVHPEWRARLWAIIRSTPNLDWLLLSKRPANFAGMLPADWGQGYPNVWLGVTAENQEWADRRLPVLTRTPARVRFVSAEPLLGPLDLMPYLDKVDWVIAGGESGESFRPLDLGAVRGVRDQCVGAGVAFFFKQHGGRKASSGGCELDGEFWKQFPRPDTN